MSKSTNSNFLNKNSAYIESLMSFILDTKPYHCKLTETVEEYQFHDSMHVTMRERVTGRQKLYSHCLYNYYSGGNVNTRNMRINRLFSYLFKTDTSVVGIDENKDMVAVPFVYNKKWSAGEGPTSVRVFRPNGFYAPLVESVDYYDSHGSFQFMVKQTFNASGDFDPLWQSTQDANVILEATKAAQDIALDLDNPRNSVEPLIGILTQLKADVIAAGGDATVESEIDIRLGFLTDVPPRLPRTYEALYNAISANPILVVAIDLDAIQKEIKYWSPAIILNTYSDMQLREGALIYYVGQNTDYLNVSTIRVDFETPNYEEWTLTCVNDRTQRYNVVGSSSGFVGFFLAGESFTTGDGRLSFNTTKVSDAPVNFSILLIPSNRIVIHPDSYEGENLETWDLIKIDPIAHDRPLLDSENYGRIYDLDSKPNSITIIDQTVPTSSFFFECFETDRFKVTNNVLTDYVAYASANVTYSDSKIGFTIRAGRRSFKPGDHFIVDIENEVASTKDLNVAFGYDIDSFDNDHLMDELRRQIGFFYDSRFPYFDLSTLNVDVKEHAIHKRRWRATAIPNKSKPISTIKKDGSGPSPDVDLDDATSGISPDPASDAPPKYKMDPSQAEVDLILYYADTFRLEYSDNDFVTSTVLAVLNTGDTFTDINQGVSFTIAEGDKPYIGVDALIADTLRIESGDIIEFQVWNPPPFIASETVELISAYIPRLEMHSSGFWWAPAATWLVEMISDDQFTVTGTYTEGTLAGTEISAPVLCDFRTLGVLEHEGYSYKGLGISFTVEPGDGLSAGDKFAFNTFSRKPSWLVNGAASGYTKPAVIGEWYWNGKIGFKLHLPSVMVYDNDRELVENNLIEVLKVRPDHETTIYRIRKSVDNGYVLSDNVNGILGHIPEFGTYDSDLISFKLNGNLNSLFGTGDSCSILVENNNFDTFTGQDTVIIHGQRATRNPQPGGKVTVTKTEDSRLNINISTRVPTTENLMPMSIDIRNIDPNYANNIPENPELGILNGWIPYSQVRRDSVTSEAAYCDPATLFEYYSAATGERIGEARSLDSATPNTSAFFIWDQAFWEKYLPVNAEANLVTGNQGWNDPLKAYMSESLKMLIGAGGFDEDYNFKDVITAAVADSHFFYNDLYFRNDKINAVLEDGPLDGYLPGFANIPFDSTTYYHPDGTAYQKTIPGFLPEDFGDGFDQGFPPDIYSLLAKYDLPDSVRDGLIQQVAFYLMQGKMVPTTQEQWDYYFDQIRNDPNPGGITHDFGIPNKGKAFDVVDRNEAEAATSLSENMQIRVTNAGPANNETLLIIVGNDMPTNYTYVLGQTWDQMRGYAAAEFEASIFELTFPGDVVGNLTAMIFIEGEQTPHAVPIEKISSRSYRITLTSTAKVKIDLKLN